MDPCSTIDCTGKFFEAINEVLGDVPLFTQPGEHCSELRSFLENLQWFDLSYSFEGAGCVTSGVCMETHKCCAVALCVVFCKLSDIYQSLLISCASVEQYDHFFQCQGIVQQDDDVDVPLLSEGMIGSSLLLQYFCCTGYLLACALIVVSADFSMFGIVCCSVLSSYLLVGFIDGRLVVGLWYRSVSYDGCFGEYLSVGNFPAAYCELMSIN